MLKSTETAVRAICATDPSITPEQLRAGLADLAGETANTLTDQTPIGRALTIKQVAAILGVCKRTVRTYGRNGLIRGIGTKDKRGNIRLYSEASVRAFLAGDAKTEDGNAE